MIKPVVAVLFGGRSSEHSISSATAGGVLHAIDRDRYDVVPVGITREGVFVLEDDAPACVEQEAREEVEEAVRFARESPFPAPGLTSELVYG